MIGIFHLIWYTKHIIRNIISYQAIWQVHSNKFVNNVAIFIRRCLISKFVEYMVWLLNLLLSVSMLWITENQIYILDVSVSLRSSLLILQFNSTKFLLRGNSMTRLETYTVYIYSLEYNIFETVYMPRYILKLCCKVVF